MTRQMDLAYDDARTAMLACLDEGAVDAEGLKTMQTAMNTLAPNRRAFGLDRYHELKVLLEEVERLPIREPMLATSPQHAVPPLAWPPKNYDIIALIAAVCFAAAFWQLRYLIVLILMGYYLIRAWLYLSYRFPRTMLFFNFLLVALLSSGRGRRRW